MKDARVHLRWATLLLSGIALVTVGAGATYWVMRYAAAGLADRAVSDGRMFSSPTNQPAGPMAGMPDTGTPSDAPLPDVAVPLSQEAVARAGIEVTTVGTSGVATAVRVPGVVQPNAYRSVVVTSLVAGRITRVEVELGQHVRRGLMLAGVYSPEVAEAQTRFLSSRAELEAHEQALRRTEKLVEIGAASRQELEKIHAEHTAATTTVESHRARLRLLGMSDAELANLAPASELQATAHIVAPIDGVITVREVNAGLNVEATAPLFTIVDLSTVWVVADVYERDFSSVRVGSVATVTTTAYPDLKLQGKVSYIDPQVKPDTRTAQIRVEVPNSKGELRLGMYAEIQIGEPRVSAEVAVPRSAVQVVGNRSVVYLVNPNQAGQFIEREVRLGQASGDNVAVLSGVQVGDVVATKGSFSIRAERERLGLRPPRTEAVRTGGEPAASGPSPLGDDVGGAVQIARVTVSDQGYEPARVSLRAGAPARLTFVRTSDKTCGTEVTIPSLNIKRTLPLNEPVDIEFTPTKGEMGFVCGMGMLKGTIVGQ